MKNLIKLFYLLCSCKKSSSKVKLGEFKSDQKYFANKLGNPESLEK